MDGKGNRLKMNGVISVCWLVNETARCYTRFVGLFNQPDRSKMEDRRRAGRLIDGILNRGEDGGTNGKRRLIKCSSRRHREGDDHQVGNDGMVKR